MADTAPATRLAEIRTAITAIMTGAQSYQIGGRQLTRANLKELHEEARRLVFIVEQDADGDAGFGLTYLGGP